MVINKGKLGRVIPVKVIVYSGGVQQTDAQIAEGNLTIAVNTVNCTSGAGTDTIEVYADAGQSNAGTNQFRYTGGSWIYNLDTKAVGMVINPVICYRLDVYLNTFKISTQTYAIFQPVK